MALPEVFVDADACPVKKEVYRVAERYGLCVKLVANMSLWTPDTPRVESIVVNGDPDAADDWIAVRATANDIVVTDDIPLASRCIKAGARVLTSKGRVFTEASIGEILASRDLLSQLRDQGAITGGPAPLQDKDRSLFLQRFDQLVNACLRLG
ncbi:MAG: YaiI/YqxD family protein [FCB group bacterium]|jgi:uncharacterized protein YaiI (UPF0178 family)|nr:YaiI/YqxD family protein [FCB group bacterium]